MSSPEDGLTKAIRNICEGRDIAYNAAYVAGWFAGRGMNKNIALDVVDLLCRFVQPTLPSRGA